MSRVGFCATSLVASAVCTSVGVTLLRRDWRLVRGMGSAAPKELRESRRSFMEGGYKALRDLRDSGEISAIGLGVNEVEVCIEALEHADLDVILLASRYTLLEQTPLDLLFPMCAAKGVSVVVGGPYSSGILATGARKDARYDYGVVPDGVVAKVTAIEQVCRAYAVPLATAALRFPLGHPQVATVLPGLGKIGQVQAALDAMSTPIPSALWDELKLKGLLHPNTPTAF